MAAALRCLVPRADLVEEEAFAGTFLAVEEDDVVFLTDGKL